jgi:hypothetical protein
MPQTRLNPFRSYSEESVINLYSLDDATGEAGALVKVSNGNFTADPVQYLTSPDWTSPLGHARSRFPVTPYKVTKVSGTGEAGVLGLLLRDVRRTDENGENLLYYPQKKAELQCVYTGETVPIATEGIFELNNKAFAGGVCPGVGMIAVPAAGGRITGVALASASTEQKDASVGKIIGTGFRTSQQDTDAYAGAFATLQLKVK